MPKKPDYSHFFPYREIPIFSYRQHSIEKADYTRLFPYLPRNVPEKAPIGAFHRSIMCYPLKAPSEGNLCRAGAYREHPIERGSRTPPFSARFRPHPKRQVTQSFSVTPPARHREPRPTLQSTHAGSLFLEKNSKTKHAGFPTGAQPRKCSDEDHAPADLTP